MLNGTIINLNSKPENPFVVRQEGVIIDAIHSQAFLFGESDMSKFKRTIPTLCACGCGERVKWGNQNKKWNKYINGHSVRDKKWTLESRNKISKANKRRIWTLESRIKVGLSRKGYKHTEKTKKKIGKSNKNPSLETRKKISKNLIGRKFSKEHKKKLSIIATGKYEGDKNPNWRGGISCEPYCQIWTDKEYKQSIKDRDGNECQNPDCWNTAERVALHHINYIKKDCSPLNLITLCTSCNSRANKDREEHTLFYQNIMKEKYGYKYA